jgi:hypothetical protein
MGEAGDAMWKTTSMGSSIEKCCVMSAWMKQNSGPRMCAMLRSDPVSTLSTQITR